MFDSRQHPGKVQIACCTASVERTSAASSMAVRSSVKTCGFLTGSISMMRMSPFLPTSRCLVGGICNNDICSMPMLDRRRTVFSRKSQREVSLPTKLDGCRANLHSGTAKGTYTGSFKPTYRAADDACSWSRRQSRSIAGLASEGHRWSLVHGHPPACHASTVSFTRVEGEHKPPNHVIELAPKGRRESFSTAFDLVLPASDTLRVSDTQGRSLRRSA